MLQRGEVTCERQEVRADGGGGGGVHLALQLLAESLQLLEGLLHGGLVAEARLRQ